MFVPNPRTTTEPNPSQGKLMPLTGIAEILSEAERNNDRRDITGALAIRETHFLHVLEGRRDELDALLQRLERAPRHRTVPVLDRRTINVRMFEGRAMKGPLSSARVAALVEEVREGRSPAAAAGAGLLAIP